MERTYTVSNSDIAEARHAAAATLPKAPQSNAGAWFGWVAMAGFIGLVIVLIDPELRHRWFTGEGPEARRHLLAGLLILGISTATLIFVWFVVFRYLRQSANRARMPILLTFDVLDDGIAFTVAGRRHEMTWACFTGFSETQRLFLLHQAGGLIRPIPKAVFATEAEQDGFRQSLKKNMVPQSAARYA